MGEKKTKLMLYSTQLKLKLKLKLSLAKMYMCSQGICHSYIYERGRTGGWQDMHCPHCFKVCYAINLPLLKMKIFRYLQRCRVHRSLLQM